MVESNIQLLTWIKLGPRARQSCNNPYNIHGDAKIHIASRARPRGAIHLRVPPARRDEPELEETRWRSRARGDRTIRAARSSAARGT